MEARDQKLYGAGELHRFNRDVEDALSRMQEKYTSIPEELGRDLKTVQSYIKKHEGFENDLVALEAQVRKFKVLRNFYYIHQGGYLLPHILLSVCLLAASR